MKNEDLLKLRHTAEHVLTQALVKLYPEIKLAMGPATSDGFYADFELPADQKVTEDDFVKIEAEMQKIIKGDAKLTRLEMSADEARSLIKKTPYLDNTYKIDWLEEIKNRGEVVSFYKTGEDFIDLCAGPHLASTGQIKAFKLLNVAGAYWHGDSKNKMLTRIYGTAFDSQKELDEYLKNIEEAKKRDHRKIGKELDLFSVDDYVGSGLILWHPKLSVVREQIELYWRSEHRKRGYEYVYTPHVGLSNLWETSGHLEFFKEGMYPPMEMASKNKDEPATYYVKPMNCPFHVRIYKSRPRSYRELPLRWCELGNVYRYEESGVLHGMLRVRGFTQDDAHIICREDQFVEEVNKVLDFALDLNKNFGFDKLNVYLSIRDKQNQKKYVGESRIWDLAEKTLTDILKSRKIEFKEDVGGAKFYGPAIDLKAVDSMGREWQGTTIQLDMHLPSRFEMTYIANDGSEKTPIMLHRTLLGSMERFVGTLIEQYAGAFPVWLHPTQVAIIPISEKHTEVASKIKAELQKDGIRVEVDDRSERMQARIRDAQIQKIPYILIVGDKEAGAADLSASVRLRTEEDLGIKTIAELKAKIKDLVLTKSLSLW